MKIAILIPSRYGSTRFPAKPLAKILGKPMIQHVFERSAAASMSHITAVATDDQRIMDAVEAFGGRAVMTSVSCRSGTDRVREAGAALGLTGSDIVVNVQGDQPLIKPRCLDQVTAPLIQDPGIGMSTLAFEIVLEKERTDPKDVKVVMDKAGFALYFSRAPLPWGRDSRDGYPMYKHLGVYAYTMDFLETFAALPEGRLEAIEKLEQLRALEHGHPIRVVVTEFDSPEVDLPSDIPWIESLMEKEG